MVSATEQQQGKAVAAENDRERQARQAQEKQQLANNQADWIRYIDSRIDSRVEAYLNSHRAGDDSTLPDALHEALGQIIAEERRQWRRERALIESEAQKTISDLRAVIAELTNEIRQKVQEAKPGVQGERGEKGPPGPPGKLPIAKTFEPGRVYYEGEIVIRDGSTYQALRDTGHGVAHADWICLAKAGRDGRDGLSPDVRGTYDAHERYAKLDIVASEGAAFIAKYDNPGICPGAGWQLMSQQGRRGKPGKDGERGMIGPKGDRGPPGESAPVTKGWKIDRQYFRVFPVLSNGQLGEELNIRELFEEYRDQTGGE